MSGPNTIVAVLAAGRASRFGSAKLDAPCAGLPLGAWALSAALGTGFATLIIFRDELPAFARRFAGRAEVLVNRGADAGLGSSLRCAARHAAERSASRLIVLPADMPLVTSTLLVGLVEACTPGGASACRYPGPVPGVPATWSKEHFAALGEIAPADGAKTLLSHIPSLAMLDAGTEALIDVDTPGDLAHAETYLHRRAAKGA